MDEPAARVGPKSGASDSCPDHRCPSGQPNGTHPSKLSGIPNSVVERVTGRKPYRVRAGTDSPADRDLADPFLTDRDDETTRTSNRHPLSAVGRDAKGRGIADAKLVDGLDDAIRSDPQETRLSLSRLAGPGSAPLGSACGTRASHCPTTNGADGAAGLSVGLTIVDPHAAVPTTR